MGSLQAIIEVVGVTPCGVCLFESSLVDGTVDGSEILLTS